jgi:hypothetical protein
MRLELEKVGETRAGETKKCRRFPPKTPASFSDCPKQLFDFSLPLHFTEAKRSLKSAVSKQESSYFMHEEDHLPDLLISTSSALG